MKINYFVITLTALLAFLILPSCKRFIDPGLPETGMVKASVFESDGTANGAVLGIYYNLMYDGSMQDYTGISAVTGLYTDELRSYSSGGLSTLEAYANSFTPASNLPSAIWQNLYSAVYQTNSAIEGLNASHHLTPSVRDRLLSEVKCIRAFLYFNLVNLYGDVPLILTTDYERSRLAARKSVDTVYAQIQRDLREAEEMAQDDYISGAGNATSERIRVNKPVVEALRARVFLYQHDYVNAENYASKLINNSALFSLESDLNKVFLNTSREAIWQLKPQNEPYTYEGWNYILTSAPSTGLQKSNTLSDSILNSFPANDNRKTAWIGQIKVDGRTYYFPHKYKAYDGLPSGNEYLMMIRLAEMYLIRAEARAEQGRLTGSNSAVSDLEIIRTRAGITEPIITTSYSGIIRLIEEERKRELFTEGGHRFFDLKRWKGISNPGISRIDEVMPAISMAKGGSWAEYKRLFPIPQSERLKAPNLSQNPGYAQ